MISDEQFKSEINEALFHFKNQNYLKSIKILEVLKNKRDHFLIFWYLGHSFFRVHNYDSAINCIKKSIELKKPDHLNLNFKPLIDMQILIFLSYKLTCEIYQNL